MIDSGSPEAQARDRIAERGFAETERRIAALEAELAKVREELSLIKIGEPNHPDRAYATKGWFKTFGFAVYAELRHGPIGAVLTLLQSGDISRGKAAEAIAELLVGGNPVLPPYIDDTFGDDDIPREVVAKLREERDAFVERAVASWRKEVDAMREERDSIAAALDGSKNCPKCNGFGYVDDGRSRIYYETDSAEEHNLTDMWHRRKCDCRKVDPAAILAARDARMKAEGAAEELERRAEEARISCPVCSGKDRAACQCGRSLRARAAAIRKEAGL